SFMNSTAGAINLNTKTYPDDSEYFLAPTRKKPVEAVFKNLRSDSQVKALVDSLQGYQVDRYFKYVGEIAGVGEMEMAGVGTQFKQEEMLRNLASCLTTKSNTFGVWGVGQAVRKRPFDDDVKWGEFQDGDEVQSEKRFFAIVERYIWPGKDGVPGNAHVDSNGEWDRHAKQKRKIPKDFASSFPHGMPGSPPVIDVDQNRRTGEIDPNYNQETRIIRLDANGTYPQFDGPQEVELNRYAAAALGQVEWQKSSLEDSYNPPQAVTKYRIVYFKYLDE
ncbi:MAG: hypothetical protein AAF226_12285, partial [Verrucomicrobiota bacterium]